MRVGVIPRHNGIILPWIKPNAGNSHNTGVLYTVVGCLDFVIVSQALILSWFQESVGDSNRFRLICIFLRQTYAFELELFFFSVLLINTILFEGVSHE